METLDLAALVVFGLRGKERFEGYLSNESIEGVVVLPLRGDPTYITWTHHRITRRFPANMRGVDFWIEDVRVGPTGQTVAAVLKDGRLGAARIGVVGLDSKAPGEMEGIIPYRTWATVLEALPGATFADVSLEFSKAILVKSPEEQQIVRHCAAIGESACRVMLDMVRPGVRERDIYAAIMEVIHKAGATTPPPNLIISVGADDVGWAPPFWTYWGGDSRTIREGDLVQAEIMPAYAGLETQQQMSIAIEPVPMVLRDLATIARRSYEIGRDTARPGISFQELDEAMAQPAQDSGAWTLTPLVHTLTPTALVGRIGINIDKVPALLQHDGLRPVPLLNDIVLAPGQVFALEPDASRDNHRVNLGGTILIGDDGAIELNAIATNFHIIG
ncbi:M24 family metallopeptidase [Mesorhizobium sp. CO1-1-4]|uniref:M24 family metallopeptidase n=1 Tax=Mesorhizobium sp. CO1-1-4 TaxID=2876633 RepID=UPI001CCF0E64|nr:M24 family metallopeptidase [Mesorhizobium sp. CO1-1-4]MBZ9738326.1 M24 family metallopeptidase [Mesorhizobium sp. CO1-1-4]